MWRLEVSQSKTMQCDTMQSVRDTTKQKKATQEGIGAKNNMVEQVVFIDIGTVQNSEYFS
jgi:hypothetical protein